MINKNHSSQLTVTQNLNQLTARVSLTGQGNKQTFTPLVPPNESQGQGVTLEEETNKYISKMHQKRQTALIQRHSGHPVYLLYKLELQLPRILFRDAVTTFRGENLEWRFT